MKQALANLWRAIVDHPKTTAGAVASLVAFGVGAYHKPELLTSPEAWASVFAAVSLLAASDAKQ